MTALVNVDGFFLLTATHARSVAEAFFNGTVIEWGPPRVIISDRDARFSDKIWRELMSLYGCELFFSTAFHPQTDGMVEVTNRTLKQLLLCCAEEDNWEEKLLYLELVFNSSPPSRTKESPLYVKVGRQLKFPVDLDFSRATVPAATKTVGEMQAVWERVRQ